MLKSMRNFGQTLGARIFLIILALSFVAFGIGGYLVSNVGSSAVTVNGEDVSLRDLETIWEQRKQQVTQMIGETPTNEQLLAMGVPDTVLTEAITRTVLRQTAHNMHIAPATAQVRNNIAAIGAFQGPDGTFDLERYRRALAQVGLTSHNFEKEVASDLTVQMLANLVQVSAMTQESVKPLAALENAALRLETFSITPASVSNLPAPNKDALMTFYKDNQALYTLPEKRSFSMILLDPTALADSITVSDEQIQKYYDENKESLSQPETRSVRHILVADEAKAKELASKATSLDSFIALAKENSEDPGSKADGGLLGDIAKTDVVPEFGDVAFNLPIGKVSSPVKSSFGWHVIWVEGITPSHLPALSEMKEQLAADMKAIEAQDAYTELLEQIHNDIEDGKSISKIADSHGLEVVNQPLMAANATVGAAGMPLIKEVLDTVFNLETGVVSDALELSDGRTMFVSVNQITPSRVQAYDEVANLVATDARKAQIRQAMQVAAQAVLNSVRTPAGPATLAAAARSLKVNGEAADLTINGLANAPRWTHEGLLNILQLAQGETLPRGLDNDGNITLVRMVKRDLTTPDNNMLSQTAGAFQKRIQADAENLIITHLIKQADVEYNVVRLRQMFGANYTPNTMK